MKTANLKSLLALVFLLILHHSTAFSQCSTPISTFPYQEDFETGPGGWSNGGTADDWALGTPSKPVIANAAGGTQCWITGGLTASFYNLGERSYVQSPCFDFTTLDHPLIRFNVFWETEYKYDGANLQYSLDAGATWTNLGIANEPNDCHVKNWYNYASITNLNGLASPEHGWSGNTQSTSGNCQGGNGSTTWVEAEHCMNTLAHQPQVIFRFAFGAGTTCNNYDGFAFDNISIEETTNPSSDFTISCVDNTNVNFSDATTNCPDSWTWNFADNASGSNLSTIQNPSHNFSGPGDYSVMLITSNTCSGPDTIYKTVSILSATDTTHDESCAGKKDGSMTAIPVGSGSFTYAWNTTPVQTGAMATNLLAGIYTVVISGPAGTCPFTLTDTVKAGPPCEELTLTNIITPNFDGKNDGYYIKGLDRYPLNHISIFNRWGKLVYEKDNYVNGLWRGLNSNGDELDDGTYYILFEAPNYGIKKNGWVKLLRKETP